MAPHASRSLPLMCRSERSYHDTGRAVPQCGVTTSAINLRSPPHDLRETVTVAVGHVVLTRVFRPLGRLHAGNRFGGAPLAMLTCNHSCARGTATSEATTTPSLQLMPNGWICHRRRCLQSGHCISSRCRRAGVTSFRPDCKCRALMARKVHDV